MKTTLIVVSLFQLVTSEIDVTDPTVCWPISKASELPSNCLAPTWSLDGCPKCWENSGTPMDMSPALKEKMKERLNEYIDLMLRERPASKDDSTGGTVFSGVGGRALILLKLFSATSNSTYLSMAKDYVHDMESKLLVQETKDLISGFVGFMWSRVGMWCVSALYADMVNDTETVKKRLKDINDLFEKDEGKYDDFDAGRAGLLFAARFLRSNIHPKGQPKISEALLRKVALSIIQRGYETGVTNGHTYLQWHGPNDSGLWLGQSHGTAGVIQQLVETVPDLFRENVTARKFIEVTLDNMVESQFSSGNFPTEYYNATQDVLVQWDHGAPGISAALLASWKLFQNETYLRSAERALECTWKRGLIFKGLMNCHGISGNTWMQLYAAQITQNRMYAQRAVSFQYTVLNEPLLSDPTKMRQPQPESTTPWMFWVGSYMSSIELWTDMLYRGPMNSSMTGFMPDL